jgi:hypothetical protein
MSSLITRASAVTRSPDSSVSLVLDPTTATWIGVVFMRTQEGVFFMESSFGRKRPDLNTVYLNTFMRGRYSKRPYQLGQGVDASLDNCILALFHDLCAACELKAHGLAQLAYPEGTHMFSDADLSEIVAQARWEGYVSPADWDAVAIMMLYTALDLAGYSRLRAVMEMLLRLPPP